MIICGGAFTGCSSMTSIKLPNGLTSLGEDAFYGYARTMAALHCVHCPVDQKILCAIRLNTNYRNPQIGEIHTAQHSTVHVLIAAHRVHGSSTCHPSTHVVQRCCIKENMRYWCAAHPNMGSRASSWLSSRDTHLERRPGSHTARSADDGAMPDTASSADGAMPDDTRSFNVVGDPFHRLYHRPGSHLEIHISFHRLYHRPAGKAPVLPYHDFPRGEQMTPSPTRRWRSPPRPRRRSKDDAISHAEMALTSAPTTALKRATRRPCRASPTPLPPREQTWELACLYLGCRRP